MSTAVATPTRASEAPLRCEVVDSIRHIGPRTWQSLRSGDDPLTSYGLFEAMEHGGIGPSRWAYLTLTRDDTIVGVLPVQHFAGLDLGDLVGHGARRKLAPVRRLAPGALRISALFAGNPLGSGAPLLRGDQSPESACQAVLPALRSIARRWGAPWIVWKDLPEDLVRAATPALHRGGFFRAPALPDAVLDLSCTTFAEYVASLPAKPRRNLRAKLRRLERADDVALVVIDRADGRTEELINLYRQVRDRAESKLDTLTPQFLDLLLAAPDCQVELIVATRQSRAIAFLLTLAQGERVVALRVGLDYDHSHAAALYHNVHYRAIEQALARGRSRVELLQTAYEAKLEMGARLEPLEHAIWHRNRLLRPVLARYLPAALAAPE